jgi:hypothetical protein
MNMTNQPFEIGRATRCAHHARLTSEVGTGDALSVGGGFATGH